MNLRIENHVARAYDLLSLERYDLALEEVQSALEQDPHSAEAHVCGAWVLRGMGRLEEAEDAARAGLAARPGWAEAYSTLACVLWSQGHLFDAESAFKSALSYTNPNRTPHLCNYARFLSSVNRHVESLEMADQAVALSPNYALAHQLRGNALYTLSHYDDALAAYRETLRLDPNNAEAHNRLGQLELVTSGNAQVALPSLWESLRLQPGSREARANLALALRARHPIYGRLLAFTQWSKSPRRMVYFYWVSGIAGVLIFLMPIMVDVLVYGLSGPMSEDEVNLWMLLMLATLTLYLAFIAWWRLIDPLFNTLLLLDPVGRRVLNYELTDAVGVGLMALSLLCLLGFFGALIFTGPFSKATLVALCLCLAGVLSMIFSGGTRGARGPRRWLAWGSYAILVTSLYALAVGVALRQDSLEGVAIVVFPAVLAVYGMTWIFNLMEARGVAASVQRRLLQRLVVTLAFIVVGAIVGVVLKLNFTAIVLLACAGFYGAGFWLVLVKSSGLAPAPLYRRWAVRYGVVSARRRFLMLLAAATVFLVGMAFLCQSLK